MREGEAWRENTTPFIQAAWQPATLLEPLLPDYNSHCLLKGSGLFLEDIMQSNKAISPKAYYSIIDNCCKQYPSQDLSFRFGQRLFPGHFGEASTTINSAACLQQFLLALEHFGDALTPGLCARTEFKQDTLYLFWESSFGPHQEHFFLCSAYSSAVKFFVQSKAKEKWPWQVEFTQTSPEHRELYDMYLGDACRFQKASVRMSLPLSYLHTPWENGSQLHFNRGMQMPPSPASFMQQFRACLHRETPATSSQDRIAQQLALSPATLKRKLKQHNTSFRAQLDALRLRRAVELYTERGYNNEEVAKALGFFDEANLRRSFKRWTGMNPSQYLQNLCGA